MDNLPGKLITVYLLATLLAAGAGAWLVHRYRAALPRLMRAPLDMAAPPQTALASAAPPLPMTPLPPLPTAALWRRAEWRLIAGLLVLSALIAATHGAITQWRYVDGPWSWPRFWLLSALLAWPALPAIALLRRWSRARLFAALLAWYAAAWALAMLRSTEAQSGATVAAWLAFAMGPPSLALLLLTTRRTRAAAPWLWPPIALLCAAAIVGLDLLAWLVEHHATALMPLWGLVSPLWALLLFPLAIVALAWWPVGRFARWLAHAYAARRISELMVLFTAAWALNLGFDAISSGPWVLLPLLWIALALGWAGRQRNNVDAARAPTLLVLRVFRQDANVGALFDDVIERWRAVGHTLLIAGTDVVGQTLDAADLFDYLDRRLATRFVRRAEDVPLRLAAFDWQPDAERRWRVNECYCHDSSWRAALAALVEHADLVLMDLRGFRAHNAGCRFELGMLAAALCLRRVVVLTDPSTELEVAKADTATSPPGRFVWIELPAGAKRRDAARRVIAAMVGAPVATPPTVDMSTSAA
jgi:hypothetical protein